MPHLDLSDDKAAALVKELHHTIGNDRYPLFSAYTHPQGDPSETPIESGPRVFAAVEGV
jgi:hypothetical protein